MSNEPNKLGEFFQAWWTKQGTENDEESKRLAALAFAKGAQYATDSIERKLKEAIK